MYRVLPAVVVATMILVGCSSEKTVNQDDMTGKIQSQYKQQTGIELTEITCQETKAEVNEKISCDATNAGDVKMKISGEVTKVNDGDKVEFDWKVASAAVPSDDFETAATRMIVEQMNEDAKSVECPPAIELKVGNEVDCTANMADGSTHDITLQLTDTQGGFKIIPK